MPALLPLSMRHAASALLESLTDDQRQVVCGELAEPEHRTWTYLPGDRPGLLLGELTAEQRELTHDLLQTAFSPRGVSDLLMVLRTEEIRRELSKVERAVDPHLDQPYWLRVLGTPSAEPWSWRISGHHLVAGATVVGDQVATTPQFFGAQPAEIGSGPHRGFQSLPREQDLARQLVGVLEDDQRRLATASVTAPDDLLSGQDRDVLDFTAVGLPRSGMDRRQGDLLEALVRQYLDRSPASVAEQAWADITAAGWAEVRFTWSGGLERGTGHYYAVTGPSFVLEYDNTQESGNHVHSVWRDRRRDFGTDLLAAHYATHHGPGLPH